MQQELAKIPVGGEEKEARGVEVEATHGEEPGIAVTGHEFGHAGPSLGVAHGGQVARGLVKHEVGGAGAQAHRAPVDGHLVDGGVYLAAQLPRHDPVHRHASGSHQVRRAATARHAGARQESL